MANPGGVRIGFTDARELNTLFQHQTVPVPAQTVHALDKNLLFGSFLGCQAVEEDFFLWSGEQAEHEVAVFLRGAGVPPGQQLAYLNPAARWKSKFWPAERWAALADRLQERGIWPVLAGSTRDEPYIASLADKMTKKPVIAAGRLSLNQTAALMKRSAVYIGLDSGPMHMAALAGIPVAALFGPTHPERVGPYGVRHRILTAAGLACLGCRKRQCSHLACMEGITVDMVYDAAVHLMREESADKETG
jgi:ADP-heptose:LPS heptosyltransferase